MISRKVDHMATTILKNVNLSQVIHFTGTVLKRLEQNSFTTRNVHTLGMDF